jgi:hypothetical protein
MPAKKKKSVRKTTSSHNWTRLGSDKLLDWRICDLGLKLENSTVQPAIDRLYNQLEKKQISFRPHFWISDEWYCPDGIPGVSIPFFLMHPRLRKLEMENMLEVEGGNRRWLMKLLRHETAHALLNAYKLDQQKEWRKLFGNPRARYPDTYLPKPYSKRFVINLPGWYAQAHPHEDWAETFAVWLDPRSDWKRRYQRWPALKKLQYVDELMYSLIDRKPMLRNRHTEFPVEKIKMTLGEYYEKKRERYGMDSPEFFDIDLNKLFVSKEDGGSEKASRYIRRVRREVMDVVERWTGEYKYRINEVFKDMIQRCDEMDLRVGDNRDHLMPELTAALTMLVMNKLHSGGFHISL